MHIFVSMRGSLCGISVGTLYLLVSTTCVACSVASCSVTENPIAQVKTGRQCFALTDGNRCKSKVEGID
jgi:hypothetical protein